MGVRRAITRGVLMIVGGVARLGAALLGGVESGLESRGVVKRVTLLRRPLRHKVPTKGQHD